jgi:hypothetical protein
MYLTIDHQKYLPDQGWESLAESERSLNEERRGWESLLPLVARLVRLPSWSHVKMLSTFGDSYLSLGLHPDHKDSPLAREIAQEFHAQGTKEAAYSGESLSVSFSIPRQSGGEKDSPVALMVDNYLPATCRIETVEEFIPAHVGKVRKVVCTGGEDEAAPAGS